MFTVSYVDKIAAVIVISVAFDSRSAWSSVKVRSHKTRNEANKSCYSHVVGRVNILSLLASFAREIRFIRVWNTLHSHVKFTTQQMWIRVMGGASARQLQKRLEWMHL